MTVSLNFDEQTKILSIADVSLAENHTGLTVRVTKSNEGIRYYAVNIDGTNEGGTVTASSRYASRDDYVSLTVTPAAGYTLKNLTVSGVQGFEEEEEDDPGYSFFMPASDVTVTAEWATAAFRTQSLLLSGQIGVVFYMDLPALEGVDYSTSYMTFSIPHGTCTEEVRYADAAAKDNGRKGFTCYINSIQMAEPITATFHYFLNGEEKTLAKVYSAADYFTAFDAAVANGTITDAETIALVRSVADFGHCVQPFLAQEHGWILDADYAAMAKHYTAENYDYDAIRKALTGKAIAVANDSNKNIEEVKQSLTLDSDTAINVYFKFAPGYNGTITASIDGGTAKTYRTDSYGRCCVKICGIAAHQLGSDHKIKVTTADGTVDVTVSAMSYVYAALNHYNDENDPYFTSRNAVSAIYAYSEAADVYKAASSN